MAHRKEEIETPPAAAAFLEYCYLGPDRSLTKLAEVIKAKRRQSDGKATVRLRTLEEWSSKYQWVARAKKFDQEQIAKVAEEKMKKLEKEVDLMNERQALIGTTQQARAIKQIEELIKAEKFGALASVSLLKLALEAEREARGASIVQKIELAGKDGGPIQTSGIAIYLPKKGEER
ncbi:MAG TPA: hypothetical protein VHV10_02720 [Ktedonobacteraceae bacterium]|jgi:vacuolar-type H+-ATPase subunit I/STV1|nr:hypothetical protein [Ktedonobacteraceae bacterium]